MFTSYCFFRFSQITANGSQAGERPTFKMFLLHMLLQILIIVPVILITANDHAKKRFLLQQDMIFFSDCYNHPSSFLHTYTHTQFGFFVLFLSSKYVKHKKLTLVLFSLLATGTVL